MKTQHDFNLVIGNIYDVTVVTNPLAVANGHTDKVYKNAYFRGYTTEDVQLAAFFIGTEKMYFDAETINGENIIVTEAKEVINETEKRVLVSLHLQGTMGKCGRLNLQQRRALIAGLMEKNLLDKNAMPTHAGVAAAKPQF